MNILIMGGPGAGKGTMSAKIVEKYNINHISTGDIFRSEIGNKTELGMLAKSYMDKGLLVPDEVTNKMVKSYLENLEDRKNGFLLDGYPRTLDQAEAFNTLSEQIWQLIKSLPWNWTSLFWQGASQGVAYAKTVARFTTWLQKPLSRKAFVTFAAVNSISVKMIQKKV